MEDGGSNPRYVFGNFFVSEANSEAFKAVIDMATGKNVPHNSLYIHGGPGSGKTRLLLSMEALLREMGRSPIFVTAPDFCKELIESIRHGVPGEFRGTYRRYDYLLFDDIQHLIKEEQPTQEFLAIFNRLYNSGKKIVIAGSAPPVAMAGISAGLASRLTWGKVVEIRPFLPFD